MRPTRRSAEPHKDTQAERLHRLTARRARNERRERGERCVWLAELRELQFEPADLHFEIITMGARADAPSTRSFK
jgi:hypothetical protein